MGAQMCCQYDMDDQMLAGMQQFPQQRASIKTSYCNTPISRKKLGSTQSFDEYFLEHENEKMADSQMNQARRDTSDTDGGKSQEMFNVGNRSQTLSEIDDSTKFTRDLKKLKQIFNDVNKLSVNKNFQQLAYSLVDLIEHLRKMADDQIDYPEHAITQLNTYQGKAFKNICFVVQQINKDPKDLLVFAYELRKVDTLNLYSLAILKQNVKQGNLLHIIKTNYWDENQQNMFADESNKFKLSLAKQKLLLLLNIDKADMEQEPVIDQPSLFCSKVTSFVLRKQGALEIVNQGYKLACQSIYDEQGLFQSQKVTWVNKKHDLYHDEFATGWIMVPRGSKSSTSFHLELAAKMGTIESLGLNYNEELKKLELVESNFSDQTCNTVWLLEQMKN